MLVALLSVISHEMEKPNMDRDQAIAIAMSKCGESKKDSIAWQILKMAQAFVDNHEELERTRAQPTDKKAPVQGFKDGIPWDMHLRAYDAYCKEWGKQPALIDLEGRNCRGGFGVGELDKFIPKWREELASRKKVSQNHIVEPNKIVTNKEIERAAYEFPPKRDTPFDDRYIAEWASRNQDAIRKALSRPQVDIDSLRKLITGDGSFRMHRRGYNSALDDVKKLMEGE